MVTGTRALKISQSEMTNVSYFFRMKQLEQKRICYFIDLFSEAIHWLRMYWLRMPSI